MTFKIFWEKKLMHCAKSGQLFSDFVILFCNFDTIHLIFKNFEQCGGRIEFILVYKMLKFEKILIFGQLIFQV